MARLAPGATLTSAGAQITAFDTHQLESEPNAVFLKSAHYATVLQFLHEDQVREIRPVLLLLQGGVLLLLCIGGVNLVNLLLIRASGRAKELAVRRALGAQGKHIAREVVLETTLLAVGGGALGLGFGAVGIRLLTALGRALLPVGAVIEFDLRVALIALAGSAIVGVALALPVVWFNLRDNLAPVLQATTRGGTVNGAAQRLRHAFIIAQVALAFVLLASAGLLGLSLRRVLATGPGFQTEHILTGQIFLSGARYAKAEQRLAFSERLRGELRSMPGVASVGITAGLPFTRDVSRIDTAVEGLEISAANSLRAHYSSAPLGDYWSALGIPLIADRLLESGDNQRLPRACVVDANVANRYWPKQDLLGRRLSIGGAFDPADCYTVVGVVGSIKQNDLTDASAQGAIYYPYLPFTATGYPTSTLSIVVRAAGAQDVYASLIKQAVLKLDPEIPLDDVKNMQTRLEDSVVARRSPAVLTEIFAGVALLLAAVGTYGVLAYAVGQAARRSASAWRSGRSRGKCVRSSLASVRGCSVRALPSACWVRGLQAGRCRATLRRRCGQPCGLRRGRRSDGDCGDARRITTLAPRLTRISPRSAARRMTWVEMEMRAFVCAGGSRRLAV